MTNSTGAGDSLRRQWRRIGFRFACMPINQTVDIEKLIRDSVVQGRDDPDLYWAALAWTIAFSDLVNIPRLSRMVSQSETALIGMLADLALEHGGEKKLRHIVRASKPLPRPEHLFRIMGSHAYLTEQEAKHNLPVSAKWGLICAQITVKQDALYQRSYVLSHNQNALLRALLGPHARADILYSFLISPQQTISQLANSVGLSYQPVHAEVEDLLKNGFVRCRTWGRSCVVSLTEKATEFITALCESMAKG